MSAGYTLTPKARHDLDGIWAYTSGRWGTDQADRYLRQIAKAFADLATGDAVGRDASDVRKGYFRRPVGAHVVFYRKALDGRIAIVRVLHQRMDIVRHL